MEDFKIASLWLAFIMAALWAANKLGLLTCADAARVKEGIFKEFGI